MWLPQLVVPATLSSLPDPNVTYLGEIHQRCSGCRSSAHFRLRKALDRTAAVSLWPSTRRDAVIIAAGAVVLDARATFTDIQSELRQVHQSAVPAGYTAPPAPSAAVGHSQAVLTSKFIEVTIAPQRAHIHHVEQQAELT